MTDQDRLDSWKEIAAYLRRDVTTVQRWEKREAMPVRRHLHDKLGSVYAFRSELDAWARSRHFGAPSELGPEAVAAAPVEVSTATGPVLPAPPSRHLRVTAIVAVALAVLGGAWWLRERTEFFWSDPLAGAQLQRVTEFDGAEFAAAISRDGRFIAFESDRDGSVDVWLKQVGTVPFYNLTHGLVHDIVNEQLRTLTFSPDGSLVTFWTRRGVGSAGNGIAVWAVPVLGGTPQSYLDGAAEFDWSADGRRLVYHTPGPGDPTFIREASNGARDQPIFTAPEGLHSHFQLWSPDQKYIYFVRGEVAAEPNRNSLDVWRWRVGTAASTAERITRHNTNVTYPLLLNDGRTLLYLATEPAGSGPWLYGMDVERRVPHRLSSGLERYRSLAAAADGRRLVLTLARDKETFWTLPITDQPVDAASGTELRLTNGPGRSPRLGPGYLLYVVSTAGGESIWKRTDDGAESELWTAPDAHIVGAPGIDLEGRRIAFSVEQHGRTSLHVMNADGANPRVVEASLELRGLLAWAPDGQSITAAASVDGTLHLFRIGLDGTHVAVVQDYASDPAWAPDGAFVLYSGRDVGTTFSVKAATASGGPYPLRALTLSRGARRVRFLGPRSIVVMRGGLDHTDLWRIDLDTGTERQLTRFAADFTIRDFDVSRDGSRIIVERAQDQSDIVMLDLPGK